MAQQVIDPIQSNNNTMAIPSALHSTCQHAPSEPRAAKKKQVSFQPKVKCRLVAPFKPYADLLWYSLQDYQTFERQDMVLLRRGGDDDVLRGLESRTSVGSARRAELVLGALDAVLEEQYEQKQRQQQQSPNADELLAMAYQQYSVLAAKEARLLALEDEKVVQQDRLVDTLAAIDELAQSSTSNLFSRRPPLSPKQTHRKEEPVSTKKSPKKSKKKKKPTQPTTTGDKRRFPLLGGLSKVTVKTS